LVRSRRFSRTFHESRLAEMRAAFLAILLGLTTAATASAADEVLWMVPEFPPAFIPGPFRAGEGYGDRQLDFLIAHLPQFGHARISAPGNRLWHEVGRRDGVCTLTVARLPDREKIAVFSARSFRGSANQVIVRTDRLEDFRPYLDKSGAIELARLAADDRLRGAYTDTTSYGPDIDSFIRDAGRKTPLQPVQHLRMPLSLLDKRRVDFVFGYYMEMNYHRQLDRLGDNFTALPTIPQSTPLGGHVACSKGPLGREVISAIDALLASEDTMLAYIEPLRDWYSPADYEAARKAVSSAEH